jgi:uncharacterized membrane protein required for colicin V production
MSTLLPFLLLVIIFACVATSYTEGMWSNAIKLVNVITATLVAVNLFEPVANALDRWQSSYTFVWDFLSLWGLFGLTLLVLRELTDRISRVQVRFLKIVDRIGSGFFSVWIGWVMVCFTLMTLHTAPLSRNFLWDGFKPEESMMFGMAAPDREYLGFMQQMSMGTFCRMAPLDDKEKYVFDPNGEFLPKYSARRAKIENHIVSTQSLRTNP